MAIYAVSTLKSASFFNKLVLIPLFSTQPAIRFFQSQLRLSWNLHQQAV